MIKITHISDMTRLKLASILLFNRTSDIECHYCKQPAACTRSANTSRQAPSKPTAEQKGFPRTEDTYSGKPVHIGSSNEHQGPGHRKKWGTNTRL